MRGSHATAPSRRCQRPFRIARRASNDHACSEDAHLTADGTERSTAARNDGCVGRHCARDGGVPALLGARGHPAATLSPALVNGAAGAIMLDDGKPFAVKGFIVSRGRIVEIDAVTDPERLRRLGVARLRLAQS